MSVANINVRTVLLKRGNTAVSSIYTGPAGEVTVDTDLNSVRVHDGATQGGHLMNSQKGFLAFANILANSATISSSIPPSTPNPSALWYDDVGGRLYIYYDGTWIDASPSGDLLLNANVANLAAVVNSLESNVAAVETHIVVLDANIGTFETSVTGTVNTINANINALNETIAGFEANAGPTSDAWVDTAPPNISNIGALWYDSETGRLYVYYNGAWIDASPTTMDLGKFIFDVDVPSASAFINTTNDAGGLDGYDIVLSPGGESYSSITIPKSTNSANGAPLVVSATDANSAVVISTDAGDWIFGNTGNLTLPAGGDIRDSVSNISVLKTRIGDTYPSGAFQQLTIAHDEGKLITVAGGNSLFRLPQITVNSLGMEFEFYFSGDSGQIYIQAFYTGSRGTTDQFVGSLFVGVDNSTQGRLHTATAGVADANYLFLGQHHAKAGSYIKFKAVAFDGVGTWLVQGQCVGDTVNTTPNGQSYIFQNYYD
jgi:hypothetical protein